MEQVSIRNAVVCDLAALRRFEQAIMAAERPYDPTLREDGARYYDLERMLGDPNACVLVAETAQAPVACGFARIDPAKPYLKHARQAYLGLMYVEPAYRGQGVNARIVAALLAWCRQRAVTELRLEVYSGNATALRAYEKAGFRPHLLEMRLSLDE